MSALAKKNGGVIFSAKGCSCAYQAYGSRKTNSGADNRWTAA
jgi:hypothetical protein